VNALHVVPQEALEIQTLRATIQGFQLTPKDSWVFWCKTIQNSPFLKKDLKLFFDKYFSKSYYTFKYKTYICTTSRSFIFYFIST
jgi:hypothetical protein